MSKSSLILLVVTYSVSTFSDVLPYETHISNSYYYADHHEIVIGTTAEAVWPHLIDLGSWMYDFAMDHQSGPFRQEGEILRLYEGQEYLFEVTKLIPHELLVGVNLPIVTPEGEFSSGIAMITLTEVDRETIVSVFMSRKYSWPYEKVNETREFRESSEFEIARAETFQRFLGRLKTLSESAALNAQ